MWIRTAFFIALLALSPAAWAAPLNFYVGGSLGGEADFTADDFDAADHLGIDSSNRTWKVFGGIGIGRIFGVEAAWHDFGSVSCCDRLADSGFDLDLQGVSVNAVAGIPLSRLRLFAKAGLLAWETDGTILTFGGPVPYSIDGEDPMGGVGADLKLTRHFSVRAEWEVFEIGDGSLDVASVGVQYRF